VVQLLVKYAFRLRNMQKVWLTTNGSNERAQKAFAAAGFVEEGRLKRHVWLDGRYDDLVYMGILRDPPVEGQDAAGAMGTEPAVEFADAENEA
jgi:RimJ/RimL family protein N-acetyltransferase